MGDTDGVSVVGEIVGEAVGDFVGDVVETVSDSFSLSFLLTEGALDGLSVSTLNVASVGDSVVSIVGTVALKEFENGVADGLAVATTFLSG